ncbi:mitochondrial distribution and morphology protein 12 [Coprinopsis sp. MPI-PUGE-AT-0042]|nr:mitochondrial distribution and morphology protein 12 [Coprinopsis sp. MPI-PUGE-AT-0042]
MSIDLEWPKLDSSLANYLVTVLNRQLTNADRPSFIGPVEVTSLEFGSAAPDVEIVDLRDIYRDFLEDDEDDLEKPVKVTEGIGGDGPNGYHDDEDGFEWVPRRAAVREYAEGMVNPPHMLRHHPFRNSPIDGGFSASLVTAFQLSSIPWTGYMDGRGSRSSVWRWRTPHVSQPFAVDAVPSNTLEATFWPRSSKGRRLIATLWQETRERNVHSTSGGTTQQPQQNPHPNLQIHMHINWHSNLRITITTSLLINYPSPMFMSLPIKLSVTGLVFNGELAVAYEGERRRVHVCILDDLDPYGPAGDRPKRDSTRLTPPNELGVDDDSSPGRPQKPLPVGQRLLPSIIIESEIGQADKHVLKNVTRVERFIQDVIRKTIEEELVFPNFHTLVMGDQ